MEEEAVRKRLKMNRKVTVNRNQGRNKKKYTEFSYATLSKCILKFNLSDHLTIKWTFYQLTPHSECFIIFTTNYTAFRDKKKGRRRWNLLHCVCLLLCVFKIGLLLHILRDWRAKLIPQILTYNQRNTVNIFPCKYNRFSPYSTSLLIYERKKKKPIKIWNIVDRPSKHAYTTLLSNTFSLKSI